MKQQLEHQNQKSREIEREMALMIAKINKSASRKYDKYHGRYKMKVAKFDSYDYANSANISKWLRYKFLPHHKLLLSSWTEYNPNE